MAQKITKDDLTLLSQDWGGNGEAVERTQGGTITNPYSATSDEKPFSGLQIQKYIKSFLQSVSDKAADFYFDSGNSRMFSFASSDDKAAWVAAGSPYPSAYIQKTTPFDFSSTIYNFRIVNRQSSLDLYYTTQQEHCNLSVGFISQSKGLTETEWTNTNEDASVEVYVDRGNTGSWAKIYESARVASGTDVTVDLKTYIAVGSNRVRINMAGLETEQTSTMLFNVTSTSMYITESNFGWNTPYIQGRTYNMGGMLIGGALQKTLHVKVTKGTTYTREYTVDLGTQTWTTNAYFFTGMEFPSEGTGIYSLEIWLVTSTGLESSHLKYNIMCIASTDVSTAQLVCVNDVPETIINYASNTYFRYAIYNKGIATGTPHLLIKNTIRQTPVTWVDIDLNNVPSVTKQTYTATPSIESEEETIAVVATLTYGNTQECNYTLDNSAAYPPTTGAEFYLNPSMRNNTDSNKTLIVNDITQGTINCTWTNMAFSGTGDGYVLDDDNRKCLLMPAGSHGVISYQPMSTLGANGAKTIEFIFKVKNVSNMSDILFSIMSDRASSTFRGIRIRPEDILVHSSYKYTQDAVQSYSFGTDTLIDLIVTYTRNYKINYGNLCTIYCNGVKACEFDFETADDWTNQGYLELGSANSDLYVYGIRVYNTAFGQSDAFKNYIASLPTQAEKAIADTAGREVVDDSWNIDYDAVSQKANTMVVEITDAGGVLPHYGLDKSYTTHSTVEFHYHGAHAKDFRIKGVETSGQGTTSMNYYRWNLRFRIDKSNSDKKCNVAYWDVDNNAWGADTYTKTVNFDGDGVHTAIKRITAKTNYASSMQSHKIGATAAYNDLHHQLGLDNEASGRVAVFQHPFYGFQKQKVEGTELYTYTFIGFFTAGPDKGDKPTFGYGDTYKATELTLEGVDHTQALAKFAYPWNADVKYKASQEALCIDKGDGTYDKGFEASNCHDLDTASSSDETAINTAFTTQFKPAYEIAYNNSTMILGVTQTLAEINADVTTWRANKTSDYRPYTDLEFFTEGVYDLYYYDIPSGTYKSNGVNLLTQYVSRGGSASDLTGKTLAQVTEIFKTSRRTYFKNNVWTYFHEDDTLFTFAFLVMFGATDNFAKNMYPYHFGGASSKWRWRQDDLDTIFDIDNQGHSAKGYSIEYTDFTDSNHTAHVFRGENSTFWTLINECFQNEIRLMGQRIFTGMIALGTGSTTMSKLLGFFNSYFWGVAQDYFRKTAYNIAAEYAYEEAWPLYKSGVYSVDTNPLEQSLGSHYESEYNWVFKRMIYMLSKMHKGPFGEYTDTCLGRITFRTQNAMPFTLTPAIDLYPAIILGSGSYNGSSSRISAGSAYTTPSVGGENTNTYIQGSDWLEDIGDLKTIQLDSTAASMTLGGARLKKIKVGDATAASVTANIAQLTISASPCLTEIDARNLSSLAGTIDLSSCPRLDKALFAGTSIVQLTLADGSKVSQLSVPSTLQAIVMLNLRKLTTANFVYASLGAVTTMRMENCTGIDPFAVLYNIYNSASNNVRYIRLIGINSTDASIGVSGNAVIQMLSHIAQNLDKDNANHQYNGITEAGVVDNTIIPVLQGTLTVTHAYQSDATTIGNIFTGLTLTVSGGWYIDFLDSLVKSTVISHYSSDGIGVIQSEVDAITTFGTYMQGLSIVNLSDLYKFTHLTLPTCTSHNDSQFNGCTSITSIKFPALLTKLGTKTFDGLTLTSLDFSLCTNMTAIEAHSLENCTVNGTVDLSNCSALTTAKFDGLTSMNTLQCVGNSVVTTIKLPSFRLPDTYQEVEYLQSSGAQWIDTGYVADQSSHFSINGIIGVTAGDGDSICGAANSWDTLGHEIGTYQNKLTLHYGTSYTEISNSEIAPNAEYNIDCNANVFTGKIGNYNLNYNPSQQTFTAPSTMTLFALHRTSITIAGTPCIKNFKIYDGDSVIKNFIPCYRKSDSKPGMYDLVNKVFYVNQSSGADFTVGPNHDVED